MTEENDLIFREVQGFGLWLKLCLVSSAIVALVVIGFCVDFEQEENFSLSVILPIIAVFVMSIVFAGLFWKIRLETEVRNDGLYVRFFPLHIRFKKFTREDVEQYCARTYRPLLEYGGWGIRFGKSGRAFNMSGKRGVQLVLKGGKRLLIGSQKPEELVDAIRSFMETA